jgi:protein-tyrosine phosphatase
MGESTYSLTIEDFHSPNCQQFDKIQKTIDNMLSKRESVYIHCAAGNGRTSTVLSYYLLSKYDMDLFTVTNKIMDEYNGSVETEEQKLALNQLGRGELDINSNQKRGIEN